MIWSLITVFILNRLLDAIEWMVLGDLNIVLLAPWLCSIPGAMTLSITTLTIITPLSITTSHTHF
jgi:hypothetical protein